MSRSGYTDDCENPGLWRGAVASAIKGKRGQQFLMDLIAALDAMPDKRLIADELEDVPGGEVCAIGALGQHRGINMQGMDPEDSERIAGAFGIAQCLAQEVVYMNDEYARYRWDPYVPGKESQRHEETPEERWTRMRDWALRNLRLTSAKAGDDNG